MDPNNQSSAVVSLTPSTTGLSQSGQVDWVSILKGTAEASVSILAGLSSAGVDPLNVLVAQELCSIIPLSKGGQQMSWKLLLSYDSLILLEMCYDLASVSALWHEPLLLDPKKLHALPSVQHWQRHIALNSRPSLSKLTTLQKLSRPVTPSIHKSVEKVS